MHVAVQGNEEESPSSATTWQVPALYASIVTHSRRVPIENRFQYKACYWLVDYDDLPRLKGLAGHLARFEHSDHSDVRVILANYGVTADRILMLAMPRTFGYVFNPISVFWCYDALGQQVACLAEVHNTYGQSHTYFLQPDETGRSEVAKELYVSPFNPVDGRYDIRVSEPGPSLSVSVILHRHNGPPFVASLRGTRHLVTASTMLRASLLHPALRVALLIRWQAVRLWARGLKVQPR